MRVVPVVALFATFFGAWLSAVYLFGVPAYLCPSPAAVLQTFSEQWAGLLKHSAATLGEATAGLLLAWVLAFVLAVLMFIFRWLEAALLPALVGFKAVPLVALAPLFLIWFGTGFLSKSVMAGTISFFPLVVGFFRGFHACTDDEVFFMRSLRLSRKGELIKFRLYKATPFWLSGLRVATVLAVVGAIVAEFTGARVGLGYVVIVAAVRIDTPLLMVGIILSAACGMVLYGLGLAFERRLLRWLRMEPLKE